MRRPRDKAPTESGMTIHDIAREAGVSIATVSRALRGLSGVSPATRKLVLDTAERLDYVISPAASRLSSGRAGSIAVVTPYIARWYFSKVLEAVERVLRPSALDLLLLSVGEPEDLHAASPVRKLRRRVDGVLVIALSPSDPHVQAVLDLGLPTSLIGLSAPGATSVRIDDARGAMVATQHLLNLGHRRIGLIHGRSLASHFVAEQQRYEGFRAALAAAGLEPDPSLCVPGRFTVAGGEQAMSELLSHSTPPTAVFAMSDEMAFGALRSLRRHNLRPGEDVSVIGFDDHDLADLLDLTTIAQPVEELGTVGALSLLRLLEDPKAVLSDNVCSIRLVVRGSTAPCR